MLVNNANCLLHYCTLNFFLALISLKLLLSKTLVHTRLEYMAAVWDPGLSNNILLPERVQHHSVRFSPPNYHRTSNITSMKDTISPPKQALHRKLAHINLPFQHTIGSSFMFWCFETILPIWCLAQSTMVLHPQIKILISRSVCTTNLSYKTVFKKYVTTKPPC